MRALALAGNTPPTLLDVNNNFGMDDTRSILFHCGPVPLSLLKGRGTTEEHLMFKKSYGPGSGVGINKGDFRTNLDITFGSAKTEDGKIHAFIGEGRLTDDDIEKEFFGRSGHGASPYAGYRRFYGQGGVSPPCKSRGGQERLGVKRSSVELSGI
jgi:L-fucose isomerase-like protein